MPKIPYLLQKHRDFLVQVSDLQGVNHDDIGLIVNLSRVRIGEILSQNLPIIDANTRELLNQLKDKIETVK